MAWSELTGTTALVTGATRGFGRAIVVALHEAGADVVAVARNAEQLGHLRAELGGSLTMITMSSGAALFGSPLSGGYAGAKAAIRFITGYAAEESVRAGLGIRFVSILPKLTPATDLGAMAAAAYARQAGIGADEFVKQLGPVLAPEHVGKHIADLASSTDQAPGAYLLTPDGLKEISQ